jgi:phosphocarrier protein HPr
VFSKSAAKFSCQVTVTKGNDTANAKSIMAVLKLDVRQGDTVTVRTEGDGADEALVELVKVIESL